ncbi:MAG: ankyrin repeat domain-containing protein [Sphingobacteriia bacterium]|nr:ankyrin repeat domain-containing protein [Sphingobacteriia bacterium]
MKRRGGSLKGRTTKRSNTNNESENKILSFNTPLNKLNVALRNSQPELVDDLLRELSNSPSELNRSDQIGFTPIHYAIQHDLNGSNEKVIKQLIEIYKVDINLQTIDGETPLQIAIRNGNFNIIISLINNGAKIINEHIYSAIEYESNSSLEILKLLLKHHSIDLNNPNYNRETPLHIAIRTGNIKVINYLLDENIKINISCKNRTELQAIIAHCSPKLPNEEKFKLIKRLIYKKADVNAKDPEGNTVLHILAISGDYSFLNLLLLNMPDIEIRNNKNETVIDIILKQIDTIIVNYRYSDEFSHQIYVDKINLKLNSLKSILGTIKDYNKLEKVISDIKECKFSKHLPEYFSTLTVEEIIKDINQPKYRTPIVSLLFNTIDGLSVNLKRLAARAMSDLIIENLYKITYFTKPNESFKEQDIVDVIVKNYTQIFDIEYVEDSRDNLEENNININIENLSK